MSFPRNVKNAVDWGTSGQQELRSGGGQQAHKLKQRQTLQRRVGCLLFSVIMFTCLLDIHLLSPPFANQKESFGSEEVMSQQILSLMTSMMSALHTSRFQRPYFSGQEYPGKLCQDTGSGGQNPRQTLFRNCQGGNNFQAWEDHTQAGYTYTGNTKVDNAQASHTQASQEQCRPLIITHELNELKTLRIMSFKENAE